jgi:transposase
LFTGSEKGGQTAAVLFRFVSSCQRHGHDPFSCLRDVLTRLPDHPKDQLRELLPDRWSPPSAGDAVSAAARPEAPVPGG